MKWKRILGWTAASLLVLILVIVVGGYAVLRSGAFERYVVSKIEQAGSEATGGRVEVQSFDFSLSKLTVNVYGFVIRGTEPANQSPLLAIDKVTARLKILSVLGHRVNLRELLVEHPAVHLVLDKNGRTNIPSPNAPKEKNSQTDIFDLAVGHVLLQDGAIYYNDHKNLLQANVYDLRTEVRFNSLLTQYTGSVAYNRGELQYGALAPLSHNLKLQFSAVPTQFSVPELTLSIGSSHLSLTGNLNDYANPRVEGRYDLLIHAQDLAGLLKPASAGGDIAMSGAMRYGNVNGQPLLRSVLLDGQLESGELTLSSPDGQLSVRSLRGKYQLANGNLTAHDLVMSLLDGTVRAELNMQHLDANPSSKLQATIHGLSIAAAKAAVRSASVRNLPITGTVSGNAEASWRGSMQALLATSDIAIAGALHNDSNAAAPVPLNGTVHLNYDGPRKIIALRETTLHTPSTDLVAHGSVGNRSNLEVQARLSDLRELASFASALQGPSQGSASKPLIMSGSAIASARITGSLQKPHITTQLTAQNLLVEGTQWKTLHLAADADPTQVVVRDGVLMGEPQGQVNFSGNVGLRDWSYHSSNPIAVTLSVRQIALSELQRVARLNYPVSGIVSAEATVHGSQLEPIGNGSVQLTHGKAYNEPIQALVAQFQAEGGSVTSTLQLKVAAGAATGKVSYIPKTGAYQFQFDAPRMVLPEFEAVQAKNLPVEGVLSAKANGSGTVDDPQLTATIQIPQLRLQQTTATGVNAQLNVANHRANLTLGSDVAQATIRGKATIDLTGNYETVASLDTTTIPLAPILATYASSVPNDLESQVELHASVKGPLKDKNRLEAHVTIPMLSAKYQQLQIANSGPIRVDYANSVVSIQPSQLTGTETSLRFQGRIPMQSNGPAMDVTAQGSVNLRLLRLLNPDLRSSGTLALDVKGTGSSSHPGVEGQIKVQKASLITSDSPVGLENLNGTLILTNGRIQLTDLKGQAGGGAISLGGSIAYQPQLQFNVAINGQSVRLLYPTGIRSVFDGDLRMTGTPQSSTLDGRVLINSLSFTPDFDLASFMAQSGVPSVTSAPDSFTNNLKLNINVQSTENLQAVSSEVSVEGQANLRVIGTAADPVVVGRADLNSGDIFFMKNRYHLERGLINFVNPNRTEPTVNILITTVIQQYNGSLPLVGPVDKLRTNYTSDPPLPPVDIINLVARGQTTEESVPGNFDANQVLAAGLASQVSSRIGKLAGISSLTIDPLLGGTNGNPSARVAVQQRVTKDFVFTFSTDVTRPEAEIIQGEYQVSKRWSVSATRDQYGGLAFDGRFHTTF